MYQFLKHYVKYNVVRKRSREENRDRPRPFIETNDLAGVVFEIDFVTQQKIFLIKVYDRTNRVSFGQFFRFYYMCNASSCERNSRTDSHQIHSFGQRP